MKRASEGATLLLLSNKQRLAGIRRHPCLHSIHIRAQVTVRTQAEAQCCMAVSGWIVWMAVTQPQHCASALGQ